MRHFRIIKHRANNCWIVQRRWFWFFWVPVNDWAWYSVTDALAFVNDLEEEVQRGKA